MPPKTLKISQLKYMLLDTEPMEIGCKMAEKNQSACREFEECVQECENVWIYQIQNMDLNTQHIAISQKLTQIDYSIWHLYVKCVK